jgi:hypothetical protein
MFKTEIEDFFICLKYLRLATVHLMVNLSFIFAEVIGEHKESHSVGVEREEEVGLVVPGM